MFDDVIRHIPTNDKLAKLDQFFTDLSAELRLAATRHYEYLIQAIFNQNMTSYYEQTPIWESLPADRQRYWITFMSAGVYAIWREWLLDRKDETLMDIHDIVGTFQNATMAALTQPK